MNATDLDPPGLVAGAPQVSPLAGHRFFGYSGSVEVLLIEAMGNGTAKELQEMEFDPLPREGDFITISLGSATARFRVDAVIHQVKLGRKNKVVLRVRNMDRQGPPQQRPQQPQQFQQPQQLPMLPAAPAPSFDTGDDFYYQ